MACEPTYQGTSAASEPETYYLNDLLRTLIPDQRPDDDITPAPDTTSGLLISLHSYGNLVLWPWGWRSAAAPNEIPLQTLGRKFSYGSHYTPLQANELYPTTGDTVDWAYGELGIPAYTFELGETFFQECDDLQAIIDENLEALLYAAKTPRRPYITPSGPDVLDLSVLPSSVISGDRVQLTATIDDTRYGDANGQEPVQPIAAAAYYVDSLPWITTTHTITHPLEAMDASFDRAIEQVKGEVDTTGLNSGRHLVFVRGRDADGNWGAFSAVFLDVERPVSILYLPILAWHSQVP
jgi:carboxypeptidase T